MSSRDPNDPNAPPDDLDTRARAGDADAAAALCAEVRPALARFAHRYLGDVHGAEDVAQDALAALLGEPHWPHGPARLWLMRRVRFRCLDLLKRRRSAHRCAGSLFQELSVASPRTGPRTAVLREEAREALRASIGELPPAQAEVLLLRHVEGLSRPEIAALIDVPEATVKSRLYDANRRLRAGMREQP